MKKFILAFCLAAMLILSACGSESESTLESASASEDISVSDEAFPETAENEKAEESGKEELSDGLTEQQLADIAYAKEILAKMPISRASLIEYLHMDGFTIPDAEFTADHSDADWNAEALEAAKQIVEEQGIICEKKYILLHLTEAKGFTEDEANYGADTYLAGK